MVRVAQNGGRAIKPPYIEILHIAGLPAVDQLVHALEER
jgi:hypothetical protein